MAKREKSLFLDWPNFVSCQTSFQGNLLIVRLLILFFRFELLTSKCYSKAFQKYILHHPPTDSFLSEAMCSFVCCNTNIQVHPPPLPLSSTGKIFASKPTILDDNLQWTIGKIRSQCGFNKSNSEKNQHTYEKVRSFHLN